MRPLWWQRLLLVLVFLVEAIINFISIGGSNSNSPQKNRLPPFPISQPVVKAIAVPKLIGPSS
jgi:hypothetical protein